MVETTKTEPVIATTTAPWIPGDMVGVHTFADGLQFEPAVTALEGGGFVVTWSTAGNPGDASSYGIAGRMFDASGNPLGDEFLINSYTSGAQGDSTVTALPDGGFVVMWRSQDTPGDPSPPGISGQRFDAGGTPLGEEFRVNTETASTQDMPEVSGLDNGGFVAVWRSTHEGNSQIVGQEFDAVGTPVGGQITVGSPATAPGAMEFKGLSRSLLKRAKRATLVDHAMRHS